MSSHRASHSIESYIPYLPELTEPMESPGLCRHPTFLSTTSTPSPPPSPPTMSRLAFPNPLRSNPVSPRDRTDLPVSSLPLSPPWTANGIWANSASSNGKQALPSLTPLVLSPPTLKPSTKPPLSLNPPNPTTRRNFSPTTPQNDFPADFPISGYRHKTTVSPIRTGSHSASASLTMSYPPQVQPPKGLKQRSPSQPSLPTYFPSNDSPPGPPPIPLRMSSIPANSKPRKLSLPIHRSTSTLKAVRNSSEEKESATTPRDVGLTPPLKVSPPIRKNKALPSPPMTAEEESRTREKVVGTSPQQDHKRPCRSPRYRWTASFVGEIKDNALTPELSTHIRSSEISIPDPRDASPLLIISRSKVPAIPDNPAVREQQRHTTAKRHHHPQGGEIVRQTPKTSKLEREDRDDEASRNR
jgi:hypothetical protein